MIFPLPKTLSFIHYPSYLLPQSYYLFSLTIPLPINAILSIPLSPLQFPLMSTLLLVSWLQRFLNSTGPTPMTYPHSCWIFSVIRSQLTWTFSLSDIVKHCFLLKHFSSLGFQETILFRFSSHVIYSLGSCFHSTSSCQSLNTGIQDSVFQFVFYLNSVLHDLILIYKLTNPFSWTLTYYVKKHSWQLYLNV